MNTYTQSYISAFLSAAGTNKRAGLGDWLGLKRSPSQTKLDEQIDAYARRRTGVPAQDDSVPSGVTQDPPKSRWEARMEEARRQAGVPPREKSWNELSPEEQAELKAQAEKEVWNPRDPSQRSSPPSAPSAPLQTGQIPQSKIKNVRGMSPMDRAPKEITSAPKPQSLQKHPAAPEKLSSISPDKAKNVRGVSPSSLQQGISSKLNYPDAGKTPSLMSRKLDTPKPNPSKTSVTGGKLSPTPLGSKSLGASPSVGKIKPLSSSDFKVRTPMAVAGARG